MRSHWNSGPTALRRFSGSLVIKYARPIERHINFSGALSNPTQSPAQAFFAQWPGGSATYETYQLAMQVRVDAIRRRT